MATAPHHDLDGPEGIKEGKKRPPQKRERVEARVKKFKDNPPRAVGVQPLNRGFFQLERMRAAQAARAKGKKRAKVRGK
jgi:hypothetical protein